MQIPLRIAYCLLVHKNPEQVSRLMERIYTPSDYFYINAFRTRESPPSVCWDNIARKYEKNVAVSSKHGSSYGTIGMVHAILDAMRFFRESQFEYFINPTGQCYPLKSIKDIKENLAVRSVAHIEYFSLPSDHWGPRGGLDRIHNRWFRFRGRKIHVLRLIKRLPYNLHPYGGSDWFCLPKKHVDYILDFVTQNPKIVRFYKRTHSPSEMFFQTIIMNSPLADEVVNKNEWYIDWSRAIGSHPPILTKADLPTMLASGKLFARKFDITIDSEVLDLIDKKQAT